MGYLKSDLTRSAVQATVHCLTGCAIGEILGLVLAAWWALGALPSIMLAIVLAFFFGYSLTLRSVLPSVGVRDALRIALAADTVSIVVMEIVDNGFVLVVPGAMAAGLGDGLFWWSLAVGLVLAFFVALPVNRALIARGRGHAVMHAHHHH